MISVAQISRIRASSYYLLMSVGVALLGGSLFTYAWPLLNGDAGVIFYFIGLPLLVGVSFSAMIALAQRLFRQAHGAYRLRRAALLAATLAGILAVGAPRILMSVRSALPDATINLISSWMIVGIWAAALLGSSLLFALWRR